MSDRLSIIITTHGDGRDLPGILSSIHNQRQYRTGTSTRGEPYNYEAGPYFTKPNIEVIVSWDGDSPGVRKLFFLLGLLKLEIKHIECPKADPPCCGHNTRGPGIEAATGDWIYLTNSDNLLVGGWLHSVVQCCLPQYGIIYFDIVSNLWAWKAPTAALVWGQVDLSSVVIRAEIAKEVGFPGREYDSDWSYIDACHKLCQQRGLRPCFIREILSVHN